jgi:hypothetical protein
LPRKSKKGRPPLQVRHASSIGFEPTYPLPSALSGFPSAYYPTELPCQRCFRGTILIFEVVFWSRLSMHRVCPCVAYVCALRTRAVGKLLKIA